MGTHTNPPILVGDPVEDDVPAFDTSSEQWVPRPRGGSGASVSTISDDIEFLVSDGVHSDEFIVTWQSDRDMLKAWGGVAEGTAIELTLLANTTFRMKHASFVNGLAAGPNVDIAYALLRLRKVRNSDGTLIASPVNWTAEINTPQTAQAPNAPLVFDTWTADNGNIAKTSDTIVTVLTAGTWRIYTEIDFDPASL